jgi:hypothetical protein
VDKHEGRQLGRRYGRKAMEWFSRKTSIAGIQISNWILVIVGVVVSGLSTISSHTEQAKV